MQGIDALVSASEDCTLKVWDLSKFTCEPALSHQQQAAEIEPYVTLRGHTGPIMTMCGYQISGDKLSDEKFENIIISGGTNGNIMIWRIPSKTDVESAAKDS